MSKYKPKKNSPVRPYRTIINDSGDPGYVNRLLVGTASTGLVRIEWHQARNGQIIPANWSRVDMIQYMNSYIPLRYQVADAQNLIVAAAIAGDFEWLLLYEHDMLPQADALLRLNEYMRGEKVPVVSGLYFTRSRPSEPIIYRGRGNSFYTDWKFGDKVWVDGVPTGFLLIHMGVIREMWKDLADREYTLNGTKVRPVFETPNQAWIDPETGMFNTKGGTSDLEWCTSVIKGNYLAKAGWTKYKDDPYPFLIDTNIFLKHINTNGEQFP